MLQATGSGSLLALPRLATIQGATTNWGSTLSIEALQGGRVELGTNAAAIQVTGGAVEFKADGTDSLLDLSNLTSFQGRFDIFTTSGFRATTGGTLRSGRLTTIKTADLTLDATGVMDTAQIQSYTAGGTMTITGGTRNFSSLETLNGINVQLHGVAPQFTMLSNINLSSISVDGAWWVVIIPLALLLAGIAWAFSSFEARPEVVTHRGVRTTTPRPVSSVPASADAPIGEPVSIPDRE